MPILEVAPEKYSRLKYVPTKDLDMSSYKVTIFTVYNIAVLGRDYSMDFS